MSIFSTNSDVIRLGAKMLRLISFTEPFFGVMIAIESIYYGMGRTVVIDATGNRSNDFKKANEKMGLDKTPEGYVWHHVDDYNPGDNTFTLELVTKDAHNAAKPHLGGCAQYDAVNGSSYNYKRGEK